MILKTIKVKNFRNFKEETFIINPFLTVIVGENARGKTSLLEAIYFIVNGIGFREKKEEELVRFGESRSWVTANFDLDDSELTFQIVLDKADHITQKNFYVNKTKRKHFDYLKEQTLAILFSPEQINIITGSPQSRRDYFNKLFFYYDYEYKKRLTNYENALRKRNRVLEFCRDEKQLQEELSFWNKYMEEQSRYIIAKRQAYVDFLNQHKIIENKEFEIEYLKNEFNEGRLSEFAHEEKRWHQTVIGPQKDDFKIFLRSQEFKKDVHFYGSRSEQRLAVFWLKVNEMKYYESRYHKKPLILLDEIFAELDTKNIKLVFNLIKKYQTIITTTELELLGLAEMPKSTIHL